jgi:hypothetical protein
MADRAFATLTPVDVLARLARATPAGDKYQRYIRTLPYNDFENAIKWWSDPKQRRDFPNLSKMALDILSILAMATSSERLFSCAGLTVINRRNCLNIDTMEATECIKSWNKLKEFDTVPWLL